MLTHLYRTVLQQFLSLLCVFLPFLLNAASFRLIVTTDTHSAWRSSPEHNWLQMAAGIKAVGACDGLPLLKIDCGDTLSGSREAEESGYTLGLHALNESGFDIWIPGNHDFDAGKDHLSNMISKFNGEVICANMDMPGIKPYTVIPCGGFNVAVIGLLTPETEGFFVLPEQKTEITPEKTAVDNAMKMLRESGENFDFVILAMHRGIYTKGEKLEDILQGNNEIKLVLGGHSHIISIAEPVRNSAFSAAGHGAEGFMEILISAAEKQKHDPDMIFYFRASADYDTDETFAAAVESHWQLLSREELNTTAGKFSQAPASGQKRTRTSTLGAVYLLAMLFGEEADTAAITTVTTKREVRFPQEIKPQDIFDLIPYQNHVLIYDLTAGEIKTILAEQLAISKKKPQTPICMNIGVVCDKDGNILEITPEKDIYKVAFTDFFAAGSGGKCPEAAAVLREKPYIVKGFLRDKLKSLLLSADTVELIPPRWMTVRQDQDAASK